MSRIASEVFDWLIVGGGIHGVHIAARLVGEAGVSAERMRILDPAPRLLERWRTCTATTGMTHLRSPSVHHLDQGSWALDRFARDSFGRRHGLFAAPYGRPQLELFNAHCEHVVERHGLGDLHIQGRAAALRLECEHGVVQTTAGAELRAHQLVLALGTGEQPVCPHWAPRSDPRVQHVFAKDFDGWPERSEETVAVVGGGISAVQVALRLAKEGHAVHLISRHALVQHQFDSDPGWLGPKFMRGFSNEPDPSRRRDMISAARHSGSVTPDLKRALRRAINGGHIVWRETEITVLEGEGSSLALSLANGSELAVDRLLLATGFESKRPGGPLVDDLIASASLPCAECGYPVVDESLRWHPRVYVSGPLAELEIGPVSRNIAGARHAADRIVEAIRSGAAQREKRAA